MRLAAEYENCIMGVGAQQKNSERQSKQQSQREKKQKEDAEQKDFSSLISDWA
jgi:hypothetical protein